MTNPFLGEIRMFAFGTRGAPTRWHACDGALLSIAEYSPLFALIGTTYGGDGQTTFGVPDLRGRLPLHQGQGPGLTNRIIGDVSGSEAVAVTQPQMPTHTHLMLATSAAATSLTPGPGLLPGAVSGDVFYATDITGATPAPMATQSTTPAGGSQPHENTMPTLTVQYCIAVDGIFPSQS